MSFEMHCMSTWPLFWEAPMLGHGTVIGYTGPGWAPLTISVWWRGRGSHSFTCKLHHVCLSLVSVQQKAPP